jgi:hypothetical protein
MAIEFTCPACGGALRVRDAAVGQVVRCGGCMTMLRVPDAPPTPAQPAVTDKPKPRPAPAPPPASAPESLFPDTGETPPRPVHDTRFWLMVTAATLLLGAFGCCGLAALVLPDPEWQTHDSQQGGFRVELPGEPRKDMKRRFSEQGLRLQQMTAVEGTHLWTRAENYAIAYRDLPDRLRQTDDQILDDEIKRVLGEARQADPIDVGGFPGREFEYQAKGGAVYRGRVILAGTRVYVILAGGRFTEPDDENMRRFLESFEITDPNLADEVKRRADAAARREEEAHRRATRDQLRELGEIAAATALEAALQEVPDW